MRLLLLLPRRPRTTMLLLAVLLLLLSEPSRRPHHAIPPWLSLIFCSAANVLLLLLLLLLLPLELASIELLHEPVGRPPRPRRRPGPVVVRRCPLRSNVVVVVVIVVVVVVVFAIVAAASASMVTDHVHVGGVIGALFPYAPDNGGGILTALLLRKVVFRFHDGDAD
jgi:ABC-type Na+ efflux pump permease subunit